MLNQTLSNEPQETIEFVGGVFRLQGAGGDREADPSQSLGQTPLMLAARAGHAEAVTLLLQMGAMPVAKDEDGMQPLHYAACSGCRECCKVLLHARACAGVRDAIGRDAFACLPTRCTSDQLDKVQWAALLAPRKRPLSEDTFADCLGLDADPDKADSLASILAAVAAANVSSVPRSLGPRSSSPLPSKSACAAPLRAVPTSADSADAAAGAGSLQNEGGEHAFDPLSEASGGAPDPLAVPMTGLWRNGLRLSEHLAKAQVHPSVDDSSIIPTNGDAYHDSDVMQ